MSGFTERLPLFPTSVIGSLPRPAWLLDVLDDFLAGRAGRAEWDRACDRAVPFAVALQEAAGIDVITDGEWRREGHVHGGESRGRVRVCGGAGITEHGQT